MGTAERAAVAEWLRVGLVRGRLLFPPAVRWFPIASRALPARGSLCDSGQ